MSATRKLPAEWLETYGTNRAVFDGDRLCGVMLYDETCRDVLSVWFVEHGSALAVAGETLAMSAWVRFSRETGLAHNCDEGHAHARVTCAADGFRDGPCAPLDTIVVDLVPIGWRGRAELVRRPATIEGARGE